MDVRSNVLANVVGIVATAEGIGSLGSGLLGSGSPDSGSLYDLLGPDRLVNDVCIGSFGDGGRVDSFVGESNPLLNICFLEGNGNCHKYVIYSWRCIEWDSTKEVLNTVPLLPIVN
jgi:hypothetical protein